jgi:hypothetical protein
MGFKLHRPEEKKLLQKIAADLKFISAELPVIIDHISCLNAIAWSQRHEIDSLRSAIEMLLKDKP